MFAYMLTNKLSILTDRETWLYERNLMDDSQPLQLTETDRLAIIDVINQHVQDIQNREQYS